MKHSKKGQSCKSVKSLAAHRNIHPYVASQQVSGKSLDKILKPTMVDFEITNIINGSPK
jgi:hypothetical protein